VRDFQFPRLSDIAEEIVKLSLAVRRQPNKIDGACGIKLEYPARKAVALTTTPRVGVRQIFGRTDIYV